MVNHVRNSVDEYPPMEMFIKLATDLYSVKSQLQAIHSNPLYQTYLKKVGLRDVGKAIGNIDTAYWTIEDRILGCYPHRGNRNAVPLIPELTQNFGSWVDVEKDLIECFINNFINNSWYPKLEGKNIKSCFTYALLSDNILTTVERKTHRFFGNGIIVPVKISSINGQSFVLQCLSPEITLEYESLSKLCEDFNPVDVASGNPISQSQVAQWLEAPPKSLNEKINLSCLALENSHNHKTDLIECPKCRLPIWVYDARHLHFCPACFLKSINIDPVEVMLDTRYRSKLRKEALNNG